MMRRRGRGEWLEDGWMEEAAGVVLELLIICCPSPLSSCIATTSAISIMFSYLLSFHVLQDKEMSLIRKLFIC
jgi:hypothetical protein